MLRGPVAQSRLDPPTAYERVDPLPLGDEIVIQRRFLRVGSMATPRRASTAHSIAAVSEPSVVVGPTRRARQAILVKVYTAGPWQRASHGAIPRLLPVSEAKDAHSIAGHQCDAQGDGAGRGELTSNTHVRRRGYAGMSVEPEQRTHSRVLWAAARLRQLLPALAQLLGRLAVDDERGGVVADPRVLRRLTGSPDPQRCPAAHVRREACRGWSCVHADDCLRLINLCAVPIVCERATAADDGAALPVQPCTLHERARVARCRV